MKQRTFKLNKLVRDKIVQIHLDMDGRVKYKKLTGDKLNRALIMKLIEEAKEMQAAELSAEEIADLQEILDQLARNLDLSKQDLKSLQVKKRTKNGAFKKGHFIDTVTLPSENKWAKYYAADPKRFPEIT